MRNPFGKKIPESKKNYSADPKQRTPQEELQELAADVKMRCLVSVVLDAVNGGLLNVLNDNRQI
ncbi:MAG: hypothetical protein JXR25_07770 [Pontiellaceae bacterium]|nr:hypothetical protein [Pontiellaceae bacterium]MBN2784708.1 hypothetical protein [Pontiellaceae bacterium]